LQIDWLGIYGSDMLRADSKNAEAIYLRGMVLYHAGELVKAIAHFAEVLRVDPDHQKSRVMLKVTFDIQ
jgi:DnaJ family protein C protein 7